MVTGRLEGPLGWHGLGEREGMQHIHSQNIEEFTKFLLAAQPPVVGILCMLDRIEPCLWFLLRP